ATPPGSARHRLKQDACARPALDQPRHGPQALGSASGGWRLRCRWHPGRGGGRVPSLAGLAINLATVRKRWDLREAVAGCAAAGIRAVAPWRDQVAAIGLAEAARVLQGHGMRVTGLCRGGMFPALETAERRARI